MGDIVKRIVSNGKSEERKQLAKADKEIKQLIL
jgi:hypothetical protein